MIFKTHQGHYCCEKSEQLTINWNEEIPVLQYACMNVQVKDDP